MSSYTEGQVHQLMERFQSEGFTSEHLTLLGQYKNLGSIKDVLEGRSEIKPVEYLVDLDANPFIPEGWSLAKYNDDSPCHLRGGQWKYDPTKVKLYLSEKQQSGTISGHDLRKELEGHQPVMNANMLEFYLKHQYLIPSEWKGNAIFFWGTIYHRAGDYLQVRYLYWGGRNWGWDYRWLHDGWGGDNPAVVRIK